MRRAVSNPIAKNCDVLHLTSQWFSALYYLFREWKNLNIFWVSPRFARSIYEICPKTTFTDFLRLCSRILPLSGVNAASDPKAFWGPKCTFDMSSSEVQETHDFLVFLHRKGLIQGRGIPTCLSKVSLEHIWYIEFSKSSRNASFSLFFGPERADTGAQKSKISLKSKFGTHLTCQLSRSSKNAWFSRFFWSGKGWHRGTEIQNFPQK